MGIPARPFKGAGFGLFVAAAGVVRRSPGVAANGLAAVASTTAAALEAQ
ncbi:MAG: hypothetical protein ACOYKZ_04730 [Chlamydiia bacterium]